MDVAVEPELDLSQVSGAVRVELDLWRHSREYSEEIPFLALLLLLSERTFSSLYWGSDAIWSPVWLFCLFAALFNAIYGFITIHLAGLQYVLATLLVAAIVVCNTDNSDKMSFPGMEQYTALRMSDRPNLDEDPKTSAQSLDLIETEELLAKFQSKWAQGRGVGCSQMEERKPKLVIVAATGGGIRGRTVDIGRAGGVGREPS